MLDVSVDIETTGTDPAHAGIIQIGAVQFDYETGQIGSTFNRCMSLPADRFWSEGTREFWSQYPEVLESIFVRAEEPSVVIQAFVDWCRSLTTVGDLRLHAKPISFEGPFLQSYFDRYGHQNPFIYNKAVDLNSFIRGLQRSPSGPSFDKKVDFDGSKHDAFDDAMFQVKVLLTAKATYA